MPFPSTWFDVSLRLSITAEPPARQVPWHDGTECRFVPHMVCGQGQRGSPSEEQRVLPESVLWGEGGLDVHS